MRTNRKTQGFSLTELLLVLAIIGIISAIAIPTFMGQRRRARVIGDAQSNAASLRMQLEARKADLGVYGAAGSFTWSASATPTASTSPAPAFSAAGGTTQMKYILTLNSGGLTYDLKVQDPKLGSLLVYQTNQNGSNLFTLH